MADSYPQKFNSSEYYAGQAPPPQNPPAYNIPVPMAPVQQVTVVQAPQQVGPREQRVTCPSCNGTVITRIEHANTSKTHLMALVLCLIGCWLCCCIPYCMDSCRNINHYCPNCNAYIGSYGDK